ncbi:MAG: hypothetical protein J6S85_20580 [Methanobrevibacter sp.]|nr:hypothetical protein [Methanobrevibacter sp.]
MKVTNVLGLPQAFVDAVSVERHNEKGCYSATTILHGACETILQERHYDEIEVDASDSIWAVFGSAVHSIFEKQNTGTEKEAFYSFPVSRSKVTGRVDSYDPQTQTLHDFKTASVWKIQFADFDDWYKQGMIYAWLMKKNGVEVKRCEFIALLKDHSKSKAKVDPNYPQLPTYIYRFDVTEKALEEIEKFIFDKVAELEKAELLADEELTPCSKEERWATEDKWAIMKAGRKTALKVCNTKEEAESLMETMGGTDIEFRQGESKKCSDYCTVCQFCPFYKKMIEQ